MYDHCLIGVYDFMESLDTREIPSDAEWEERAGSSVWQGNNTSSSGRKRSRESRELIIPGLDSLSQSSF